MAISGDRAAYATEYALLDRALESERGVQVVCKSPAKAKELQFRLNRARQLHRELNRRANIEVDPSTDYSVIVIRTPVWDHLTDRWLCKLEKLRIEDLTVEDIPPVGEVDELERVDDADL